MTATVTVNAPAMVLKGSGPGNHKELANFKEHHTNFKEPTNIKDAQQHRGQATKYPTNSDSKRVDYRAVSDCHQDMIESLMRGTEKEDLDKINRKLLLERDGDKQNMIHRILNLVKKSQMDPEDWLLSEHFVKNAPGFVERLTVSSPELCVKEDIHDNIPFIYAAKVQVSIFYRITNLLIPDDVQDIISLHTGCGDDELDCPLYQVAPSLREHHVKNTGIDDSRDTTKPAIDTATDDASKKLPCLHRSIDSMAILKSVDALKDKLKSVLAKDDNADKFLKDFLIDKNFDPQSRQTLGGEILRPESFRALLDLCPEHVFTSTPNSTPIPLHKALQLYHTQSIDHEFLLRIVESLVRRCPRSIFEVDMKGKNAYHMFPTALPGQVEPWTPAIDLLKSTCIGLPAESGTDANAWEKKKNDFLYPDVISARKIFLNMSGESDILDRSYISAVKNWATIQFESVLECVRLPYWKPEERKEEIREERGAEKGKNSIAATDDDDDTNDDVEPNPYEDIFQWLAESDVTKIFTVDVNDDGPQPHTNAAIRRAFTSSDGGNRFAVEVWKWKKFDISAETVAMAAPLAREIYLYSRGNTAVLRSWATSPGLASLENLEKVVVNVFPEHEDDQHDCEDYEPLFIRTLAATCPRLNNIELKAKQKRVVLSPQQISIVMNIHRVGKRDSERERPLPTHGTLHQSEMAMHNPVEWIDKLKEFKKFVRKLNVHKMKPIKVAILDDGANIRQLNCTTEGCSFRADRAEHFVGPCSHGTDMARCILDVYPLAKLYIARLDDSGVIENQRFTVASCYEALKWALGMGVQVVSMSWSFLQDDDKEDGYKERFIELIKKHTKKVVFFGSLPDIPLNTGTGNEKYVPVCLDNVIKIGAATSYGMGTKDNIHAQPDFLLPGDQLRAFQGRSGSSYATAYASGLAAAMLHCIRAHQKLKNKAIEEANGITSSSDNNSSGDDDGNGEDDDDDDKDNGDLAKVWRLATTKEGMKIIFEQLCKKDAKEIVKQGAFVLAHVALGRQIPDSNEAKQKELERIVNTIVPELYRK